MIQVRVRIVNGLCIIVKYNLPYVRSKSRLFDYFCQISGQYCFQTIIEAPKTHVISKKVPYVHSKRCTKQKPRLFKIGYFDEFPLQNDHLGPYIGKECAENGLEVVFLYPSCIDRLCSLKNSFSSFLVNWKSFYWKKLFSRIWPKIPTLGLFRV